MLNVGTNWTVEAKDNSGEVIAKETGAQRYKVFLDQDGRVDVSWITDGSKGKALRQWMYFPGKSEFYYLITDDKDCFLSIANKKDNSELHSRENMCNTFPWNTTLGQGDRVAFYEIFERYADSIKLSPGMQAVDGAPCYVLEGQTGFGYYKVSIDPASDYQVRKSICKKTAADFLDWDRPISSFRDPSTEMNRSIDNVKFRRDSGTVLVETVHIVDHRRTTSGETHNADTTIQLLEHVSNPNFKELGAFDMNVIPEGANVALMDEKVYVPHEWRNGSFVPKPNKRLLNAQ